LINGTADQIDFSAFNGVRFLSGTEVVTDWIEAITTDEPVTVRGNGASPSDLDVDVVRADTNNGGVTILGKGTHTYDLLAESIKTDSIQSDSVGALAIGNTVGAVQITAAGNITLTSGTAIQTATLKTNLGSSITYKSAPITLASAYPNTSTTGLVAETLWTTNIPANTLSTNGSSITGEVYFTTAANNHSKTARIKFDGTTVSTRATSVNNGWLRSTFTIMRTGSSTQISFAETIDSSSVHGVNGMTTMSVTDTAAIPLIIEGETGAGIGDITVRTVILKYNRGEAAL
jgi:hypothetical protein